MDAELLAVCPSFFSATVLHTRLYTACRSLHGDCIRRSTRRKSSAARRRSLIPAAPPKQASRPGVQREQGGGWKPGGVSCFTFISRLLHLGAPTAASATDTARRPPTFHPAPLLLAALLRVREIAQATLLHPPAPSSPAPGPDQPVPRHHRRPAVITMSQSHAPDRARKYKEEPAPVAPQRMVSCFCFAPCHYARTLLAPVISPTPKPRLRAA
jgi:hypothetical protein